MWLGSRYRARQDPANSVFAQRPPSLESDDERVDEAQANVSGLGYLNFLAVGGISFLLVGHRFANRMNVEYRGSSCRGPHPHLAEQRTVVAWPPKYMMDRDLLEGITLPPSGFAATIWPPAERSGV